MNGFGGIELEGRWIQCSGHIRWIVTDIKPWQFVGALEASRLTMAYLAEPDQDGSCRRCFREFINLFRDAEDALHGVMVFHAVGGLLRKREFRYEFDTLYARMVKFLRKRKVGVIFVTPDEGELFGVGLEVAIRTDREFVVRYRV